MKGKINIKTILVMVILVFVCVLSVFGIKTAKTYLSGAAGGMEPKNVNGISAPDGKTATVSWLSDSASMGVVEYGTTPASLLLRVVEQEQTMDHKLSLSELKAGVTYYYRIRVGEEIYDNGGIPYSFKTAKDTTNVAVTTPDTTTQAPAPTIAPGAVISPVSTPSSTSTCDRQTDYNKDGVVNTIDYITCMNSSKQTGTGGTSTTVTVQPTIIGTSQPVPTIAPAVTSKVCTPGTDYNADGIANSLDMIKCRQSTN